MAAVCSGALLLENSGVLEGKLATTHWSREREFILHFPKVLWDMDQIYFLQEGLPTSAGVTAGIDMALNLIQANCGGAGTGDVPASPRRTAPSHPPLIPNFKSIAPDGINSHWLSGPLHLTTGRFQSTCAFG